MKLDELPQFTVREVHAPDEEGVSLIVGQLSHLRGVRSEHGFLYRANGPSIAGDLERVPTTSSEEARFVTRDAEYAPELRHGSVYPWLDGSWQPYHVKMVMSAPERWQRRVFAASPVRYFLLDGVMGWQPVSEKLPAGATDLGVRAGDANRARCELCPEELEAAKSSEGFIDPDGRWVCAHCFESYVRHNDISFAAEDDSSETGGSL